MCVMGTGVGMRGVLELKAELYKAQEAARLNPEAAVRRRAGPVEIRNAGVAERDRRDRAAIKVCFCCNRSTLSLSLSLSLFLSLSLSLSLSLFLFLCVYISLCLSCPSHLLDIQYSVKEFLAVPVHVRVCVCVCVCANMSDHACVCPVAWRSKLNWNVSLSFPHQSPESLAPLSRSHSQ
jgi:hypothetical protein